MPSVFAVDYLNSSGEDTGPYYLPEYGTLTATEETETPQLWCPKNLGSLPKSAAMHRRHYSAY